MEFLIGQPLTRGYRWPAIATVSDQTVSSSGGVAYDIQEEIRVLCVHDHLRRGRRDLVAAQEALRRP